VVVTEVGFVLARNPDTVRAPDIAFLRQDRASAARGTGFVEGAPELAIEVASPDDRPSDLRAKAVEYLQRGAMASVVIDPRTRQVIVHRRYAAPLVLTTVDDVLDVSDVVSGFRCSLRDIFE
jgi:Uma2 family endonuclease